MIAEANYKENMWSFKPVTLKESIFMIMNIIFSLFHFFPYHKSAREEKESCITRGPQSCGNLSNFTSILFTSKMYTEYIQVAQDHL